MPLRAPSLQITEAEARCCLGARSGRGPRRESSQRVREAAYQNLGCAHGAGVIRVVGLLRQSWSKPRWVNASENPRMSKVRPVDAPGWRAETCTSRVPLRNAGYLPASNIGRRSRAGRWSRSVRRSLGCRRHSANYRCCQSGREHVSRNKVGVGVVAAPSLRLWKAVIGIRLTARQVRPIVAKENVSVGASEYSAASHLLVFHPEPEDPLRHRHQRLRYRADRIVRANRPTRILPTLRHSPPGLDQQHRRE